MSAAQLDAVLRRRDVQACITFFQGMPEKERKAVSERALEWFEVASVCHEPENPFVRSLEQMGEFAPANIRHAVKRRQAVQAKLRHGFPAEARDAATLEPARLAVLAAGNFTAIKKLGASAMPAPDHAYTVLVDRQPEWAHRWLAFACEQQGGVYWRLVRRLEREGRFTCAHNSHYFYAMALGLARSDDVIATLKDDEGLLSSLLWQMLADEQCMRRLITADYVSPKGGILTVMHRLASAALGAPEALARQVAPQTWHEALVRLPAEAAGVRDRLLEAIFAGLACFALDAPQPKSPYALSGTSVPVLWFSALHDGLLLTLDDKRRHVSSYLGLRSSREPEHQLWLLKQLEALWRADLLGGAELCSGMDTFFLTKKKDIAVAAIRLLKAVLEQEPHVAPVVARTLVDGLEHGSQEVQKRSLDVLETLETAVLESIADELQGRLDRLSGLLKQRAVGLIQPRKTPTPAAVPAGTLADEVADASGLVARAEALEAKWSQLAGVPEAMQAWCGASPFVPAVTLDPLAVPRLSEASRITPIASVDNLLFLLLRVLEGKATADELERALDGLSRLGGERPAGFEAMVAPLRQRALARFQMHNQETTLAVAPFAGNHHLDDFAGLSIAWTDGELVAPQERSFLKKVFEACVRATIDREFYQATYTTSWGTWEGWSHPYSLGRFFSLRARAIAARLVAKQAAPLLSAPTHTGGWIEPRVLLQRLVCLQSRGIEPDRADLVQALLRLAPDGREGALKDAATLEGEAAQALRYALGGDAPPDGFRTPAVWVAAARARAPRRDDALLVKAFPHFGPDAAQAARYNEDGAVLGHIPQQMFAFDNTQVSFLAVTPEFKKRAGIEYFPTELLHEGPWLMGSASWGPQIWPLHLESHFAREARALAASLESQGSYWKGDWEPLFDPDVPLAGTARWLIVLGITARHTDVARLAVDALIAGIEDGRLDGQLLGEVMAKVLPSGKLTLTRWATNLREAARVSLLHAQTVRLALEASLVHLPRPDGKPPLKLLELLHELCAETGVGISNPASRQYLACIAGKGKGARLGKALLDIQPSACNTHGHEAARYALARRIERAERWQRLAHGAASPAGAVL